MRILLTVCLIIFTLGIKAQDLTNRYYATDNFTKVVAGKQLNIILVESDSSYIFIKNEDFMPEKFSFTIKDSVLRVNAKGIKNSTIDMELGTPNFEELFMSGAGDIQTKDEIKGKKLYVELSGASSAKLTLNYNQLTAQISGASDLILKGSVDSIYVHSSGASDFSAFEVKNIYASVQASGASDVKLNTDSTIVADLSGSSSLKYKKDPKYKKINSNESVWINEDHSGIHVSENEDTIRLKTGNGRNEIVIIDNGNRIDIKKRKITGDNYFKGNWSGLEFGINGYLTPSRSIDMPQGYEFMELKYEKSVNFNINFFQQSFNLIGNRFGVLTGMGLQWYNYRFNNNVVLTNDSNKLGGYLDNDANKSYLKSKLTASYLVVPVILEFQTNPYHNSNSFHISAGVIGGIRLGSHTKQIFENNGSANKPKMYDSFYLQPFRLDATARIGWGPINIYANYSLMEMFRKDKGPVLYPFTLGLVLPFT